MKNLIPVILSGGSGTRLWPSSRKSLPKQFKEFKNIGSLFNHTLNRVNELNGCKDLIVVSAREYEFLIKKHTNRFNKESVLILEETSKNTAAAIFFAAIRALEKSDDSILCIMPSDHWIEDFKKFTTLIKKGIKYAEQHSWVTFGIKPTEPSIGFGYIKVNDNKSTGIKDVIKFIEKPDIKRAKIFLSEGNYYWNAGIFLVSAKTVLKSFDVYNLELKKNLEKAWSNSVKSENKHIILKPYMEKIPNISIDKAIMEYQNNIKLIQFDSNWSDIGNWDSMNALLSKYDHTDNKSILIDSKNTQIQSSERVVVGIGLEDLIIVDEMDVTLIFKKGQSEKVKSVVENLKKDKNNLTEEYNYEFRPWGKFEILLNSSECKVKKIIVDPFKALSYQYHLKRSEHWTIVSGRADVTLDGTKTVHSVGESIVIPVGVKHSLANNYKELLIIIEVQYGTYYGEDDIIRVSDPYNR